MLSLCSIFYLFHDVCFAASLLVLSLKWKLMRLKSEKNESDSDSLFSSSVWRSLGVKCLRV